MSEYDNVPIHKYKVGDTYMHDGVEVKIVELLDEEYKGQPMYMTQFGNDKPLQTTEGFIDSCMGRKYGVSYIASAPEEPDSDNPMDRQIGGNHYKKCKIEPIEYIHANGLDFFQGNIVKYITRFRDKDGKKDLEKIKHYCDMLISLEYGKA